jgi:hypothetical protein
MLKPMFVEPAMQPIAGIVKNFAYSIKTFAVGSRGQILHPSQATLDKR